LHTDDDHILLYLSSNEPLADVKDMAAFGYAVEFSGRPGPRPRDGERRYVYVLPMHKTEIIDISLVGRFEVTRKELAILAKYTKMVKQLTHTRGKRIARALLGGRAYLRRVEGGPMTKAELHRLETAIRRMRSEYVWELGFRGYAQWDGHELRYHIDVRGIEARLRIHRPPNLGMVMATGVIQ
jgi:hypothetical protein